MNWKAFFSGLCGGLFVVATLSFPQLRAQTPWTSSVPYPNTTIVLLSGSCPSGYSEVTALDGAMLEGTLAAHGDVGTTGGANSITPAGTNATAAFTPAGSVTAPAFTGASDTTSSVSGGTPAGSNSGGSFVEGAISGGSFAEGAISGGGFTEGALSWPVGVPTIAAGTFTQPTISWPVGVPTFAGNAGTVPAETFTGNALATHTHTLTPTGTNATQTITSASTEVPVTSPSKYVFSTLNSAAAASSSPSITIPAEVFTGALDTSSAVSGGTPAGTNSTASFTPAGSVAWPAGVPTNASGSFSEGALSWPVGVPTIASGTFTQPVIAAGTFVQPVIAAGTFTQPTFAGNALAGHTHTLTPTGTNSVPTFSGTPGTVPAQVFSGNQFDNRPAFVKVIFCQKS